MRQREQLIRRLRTIAAAVVLVTGVGTTDLHAQELQPVVPKNLRGNINLEREGNHDANRIRTIFYNYGMVGDYQTNPDLSEFHSVEVPKGSGLNYSDGVTPFVLARVTLEGGNQTEIMLTGYRERQATSPITSRTMRFEPRPGYVQIDPAINSGRQIAISNDERTWPDCWIDRQSDADDPGWCGSWNGFFGKRPNADQESFFVMDDDYYDAWLFYPDSRDNTRRGLGLRVEVRGFQWSNPQAQNVIFWHYDIVNEGTTTYDDIVFGLYNDSGVGGSAFSCDGTPESDDDNAFYTTEFGQDLVYTWDKNGRGVSLTSNCAKTGYMGYAYLETPGNAFNGIDDDEDGIVDEMRDGGPGQKIEGQGAIRAAVEAAYDMTLFEAAYGPLEERPAYVAGTWWTGDEDMDWTAEFNDTGVDGVFESDDNAADTGERDGIPTSGEANFDKTDVTESDMIGLTGFKMNRIRAGAGAPSNETDNVNFFNGEAMWAQRLYDQFSDPDPNVRFDNPLVLNFNIAFLFASGPFRLEAGRRERFSLALASGDDLTELEENVNTVQSIYNANYQFATPPPLPVLKASAGDGFVSLSWDNAAEQSVDPVSNRNDFEGYRVYRSTDPNFLDAQVITNARGTGPFGNGRPIAQFDLDNDFAGFSSQIIQGTGYYLGDNSGLSHSFRDTTVVNGQTYYYAVTSYDSGSEDFNFFPSENAITISRTLRGGTILPKNAIEIRPEAKVPGYVPASVDTESMVQKSGLGTGTVSVSVLNPELVPDGHTFRLTFDAPDDSVRAGSYTLTDLTTGEIVVEAGRDLRGMGTGPVGLGILPIIMTPAVVGVNTDDTGFVSGSTNAVYTVRYAQTLPISLKRPGYPESLRINFSSVPLDTSVAAIGAPAIPTNFQIIGEETGRVFDFSFRDTNGNATLDRTDEFVEVMTPESETSTRRRPTWRIQVDPDNAPATVTPPTDGDVFLLSINRPFSPEDVFEFAMIGEYIDEAAAREALETEEPYVVPNPYVASASFEPERFGVSGRGIRRLEFRGIASGATIRIYTLRGELVQTLVHDNSTDGMVPWDLRSKDNLDVAPGLYIYQVDTGGAGDFIGKFAIIK